MKTVFILIEICSCWVRTLFSKLQNSKGRSEASEWSVRPVSLGYPHRSYGKFLSYEHLEPLHRSRFILSNEHLGLLVLQDNIILTPWQFLSWHFALSIDLYGPKA